jgi:hypothetical protein
LDAACQCVSEEPQVQMNGYWLVSATSMDTWMAKQYSKEIREH